MGSARRLLPGGRTSVKRLVRALCRQPLVARVECRVVRPFGSRSGEPEVVAASAATHYAALIAQ
jgi:hypothetical protein